MENETPKQKFERELKEKQKAHLEQVRRNIESEWIPCEHDKCNECFGTGINKKGKVCFNHYKNCTCPKCRTTPGNYTPFKNYFYATK